MTALHPLSFALLFGAGVFALLPAAQAEQSFRPITDPVTKKECSACHMAFPADMLPPESWRQLMAGLDDHFGENAGLDPATTQHIADYLVANAAGADNWSWLFGKDKTTPRRITETSWWRYAHEEEVNPAIFKNPRVGSKANCAACHRGAEQGFFEE